ncbi:MAG: hypothetical protein ABEH77_04695 [Halobacteriaceae archaeon]
MVAIAADSLAVFVGAGLLGLVHGAEPGHGWPVAATYALNRSHARWSGLVASTLLGLGHLVSSLAVVGVFFFAKSYVGVTQLNAPLSVWGVEIGGPVSVVAGGLLVLLGVREYRRGHAHDHGHATADDHEHERVDDHEHDHGHADEHGGQDDSGHAHGLSPDALDGRGLGGIVWTAFVLGFAHEEEFEIIGLCLGSGRCLALMVTYAVAVLVALVGLTLALVAGYRRYEHRVRGLAAHFPLVSAVVLVGMGVGFVLGLF